MWKGARGALQQGQAFLTRPASGGNHRRHLYPSRPELRPGQHRPPPSSPSCSQQPCEVGRQVNAGPKSKASPAGPRQLPRGGTAEEEEAALSAGRPSPTPALPPPRVGSRFLLLPHPVPLAASEGAAATHSRRRAGPGPHCRGGESRRERRRFLPPCLPGAQRGLWVGG